MHAISGTSLLRWPCPFRCPATLLSPGQTREDASPDLNWKSRIGSVFNMAWLKKVLSTHGKIDVSVKSPPDTHISRRIGGGAHCGKGAHVSVDQIDLEALRYVEVGLGRGFMARARSHNTCGRSSQGGPGRFREIHVQERIRSP